MPDDVASYFQQFSKFVPRDVPRATNEDSPTAYQRCKSVAARAAAAVMLFILSPVIVICAVLVRLTSNGPSFYSQIRLGKGGRTFRIVKLRTMQYRCEAQTGPVWATASDPRVTKIGRVLRRLHLDELPQLLNIARGDMCFIGPRPERPEIAEKLLMDVPNFNERLSIQPGLTGLAQVLQEADTSIDSARRKLRFDMDYRQRESLWLDSRIIVGTALIILGVPRNKAAAWLGLGLKPRRQIPAAQSTDTESIFEAPWERPKTCDSGLLGAV